MSAEASTNQVIEAGLHQINLSGTVAKGIKCTIKAILKGKAQLVLLADDTENKDYKNLVAGLCKKHNVKLQAVEKKELLGRALGLTHLKADGSVRRQMNCGACAIIGYGKVETEELNAFRAAFDPAQ
ncbi:ribosomal protein L7Ae, putative [Trichomonas vaginalis G3]|uniref:Ribosomal protein L7Ae, putative n=1 Tax=Trichomonas vaginalis (strain ATCC PRA-98 / G3) TaxID=412133 RepID=A2DW84_TRIV3|nr:structural constituent of ribosome [Trichomonas vaginalis G3]EAY15385.1 ribosomal protein L7Ae, putative [Trichomonas vaginalis G3]KAI5496740.1 structural constituent of ribosome [Trichomonas vaginalis G3]|eukprot:XP_001327608.1 ribosomal protein L7Ae [Trichomonas vaginalis G3]